ncbi:MAG: Ubiquinone biosynthesis O-methyltransferase [Syntrophaceae bacterium PtaU1.Bin231]|nr:MAG: Ubiquinone biosynthesis O-methyltransferase [Syntrophaceae bacterium PtaU1.Bin231]
MITVDFDRLRLEPGMKVLDAGCGDGRHLREALGRKGVQVVGIDVKWTDLEKSRASLLLMTPRNGCDGNGRWLVAGGDVTRLPFRDGTFDAVVCSEVLEHIPDGRRAVGELVRVLKPGRRMAVSVPSFLPERICWALSEAYHLEPGGHVRIYRKRELQRLLEEAGMTCWSIRHRHSLHSPYWWLRCLVGHRNEKSRLVRWYKRFLEWDILRGPLLTRLLDRFLNPVLAKSTVFYLRKGR